MTPAEFIDDINRQLDLANDSKVIFTRDDSFSLMTQLNILRNLQDRGQDKTAAQAAVYHVARADALDAKNQLLIKALNSALILQDSMLNEIRRLASSGANLDGIVPLQLSAAKNSFDRDMKKLLVTIQENAT